MTNNNMDNGPGIILQQSFHTFGTYKCNSHVTFIRHHYMFRTHPDINTARMTFNHQLSIEWQVCTPPHFNLQYTQHGQIKLR